MPFLLRNQDQNMRFDVFAGRRVCNRPPNFKSGMCLAEKCKRKQSFNFKIGSKVNVSRLMLSRSHIWNLWHCDISNIRRHIQLIDCTSTFVATFEKDQKLCFFYKSHCYQQQNLTVLAELPFWRSTCNEIENDCEGYGFRCTTGPTLSLLQYIAPPWDSICVSHEIAVDSTTGLDTWQLSSDGKATG